MTRLPYLLPWVRVLLLIRSITSTTWGHGPRGMAGGEAGAPARPGDAPSDRPGGLELDPPGRRLRAAHAALLIKETELAKAPGLEGCWS